MSEPNDLHAELHRHAGALRSLARDLVRDVHVADDVAQQTLQAALARRDLQPGPLGGWLARTLDNFVRQWRRGERRRAAREASLSRPEAAEAPPELLGRREMLQAVTQAVLSLDEPYQTVVFLRYFEDLPPRAIARRTGATLATVKSRLHRGLALLRERLDRSAGRSQWRLALLAAFGLPPAALVAASTFFTGAWFVSTTTKTLVAASVLCAGGLYYFSMGQEPPPAVAGAAKTDASAGAAVSAAKTSKPGGEVREDVAAATARGEAWLDHPYTFELEVLVVDPLGLPVAGRTLRLAPPHCTLDDADKATGEDGKVLLSWPSRQATGEVVLADERGTLRRVPLQHGRRTQLVLGGRGQGGPTLRMRIDSGGSMSLTTSDSGVPVLGGVPLVGNFFNLHQGGVAMQTGLHPFARFAAKGPEAKAAAGPDLVIGGERTFSLSFSDVAFDVVEDPSGKPRPQFARIAGTVFGEDGKSAAKVPVVLLGEGARPVKRGETDEQGNFAFEELLPAAFTVRAGGNAEGLAMAPAATTTGTTPVTLDLRRGSCVRGRALGVDQRPLAGARVIWRAADGTWWDATDTGQDGSFVLANLPTNGGTVLWWAGKPEEPLRAFAVPAVLNDSGELLLREAAAGSALKIDLQAAEGAARQAAEVRVWQLDTGLGATMPAPEGDRPWRLGCLPAGFYQVEVFTVGGGWQDLGKHWVDGKGDCDLGRVAVLPPATVEFDFGSHGKAAPGEPAAAAPAPAAGDGNVVLLDRSFVTDFASVEPGVGVELYQVRKDLDVRLLCGELPAQGTLEVPAGDYVLAYRGADGAAHFHRFAVQSGARVAVSLPR
jgi:RNA polymerase sigma-70 factor (ECF subfamily)